MSVYPYNLDDDTTLIRVDDNITEIAGQNFNQVRDAIFKIELELGIKPSGVMNNIKDFLEVSHNQDGTIRASALAAVGLVTLPIDNADIGLNAGIVESKLTLDYSTNTLKLLIDSNAEQIHNIVNATDLSISKLNKHIGGGPESELRHVISHIDINAIPFDTRDVNFSWDGLKNTSGGIRPATHLGEVLEQINDEFVEHQLATDPIFGHPASGISIDPSNFSEIPGDVNDVQEAIEALDQLEETRIGVHRAIMHSQGVPPDARSFAIRKPDVEINSELLPNGVLDGYGTTVVTARSATTYVANTGIEPVDSSINGDNLINFNAPIDDNDKRLLDSEFVLINPGDIVRVNYGNGIENIYLVDSTRFLPGVEWTIRIDGNNLFDTENAIVRVDRPLFDKDIWGIAAVGSSNAFPTDSFSGFLSSVIASDPRTAVALGNGFDSNKLDSNHYLLYLEVYPNGNPYDKVIRMPGIDVTGNQGATPGDYTLESVVQSTNNGLRAAGVNARFIAFEFDGNFGITMSDAINGASFSIVSGERVGGSVVEGSYINNVIGDVLSSQLDAFGLGQNGADFASPAFSSDPFVDSIISLKPTKVLMPRKRRFFIADGSRRDFFLTISKLSDDEVIDGSWTATITDRSVVPGITAKTEYTINDCLSSAGLFPGKTITVQPLIAFNDSLYNDADYGRFIIENVQYIPACDSNPAQTIITVINGVHANLSSNPVGPSTDESANLQVSIHFDNSSIGFNENHITDQVGGSEYHRLYEIFAKSNASTFAHERLRLPVQTGVENLLDTQRWRVRSASPKLRGFTDNNTSFDRFVRFYIVNYNNTTGAYDGYIGKRDVGGNGITNFGPITSGRKNVPTRFYDNTGIDYIELEYIENYGFSTQILSPAYVDIQIFTSLELNNELLMLATCEVNWTNPVTQIVERVIDRRPIGSISEIEFTQSAKDFITAGDRHLHVNGVFRGFESFGQNSLDSASFTIGGGVAIVNGTVLYVNNNTVRIPELVPSGSGSGTSLNWAICLNDKGNFIPIVLTSTKQHFFAEAGTGGGTPYHIQSVTFDEIINERKDLLLLYIVNVTINSVTINSISDARKFSLNESANIKLSLSDDNNVSSFDSIDQLITWASHTSAEKIYIKIKNNLTINSTKDLTGLNTHIVLNDDGGLVTVTSPIGLLIKDNITIDGVNFIYNYEANNVLNDNANLINEEACIKIINGASNIKITNCNFKQTILSERNPYIGGFITNNGLSDIDITNNKFYLGGNTFNCAIGFVQLGENRSSLKNLNISNNNIDGYQSVIVTSENDNYRSIFKNVTILNNNGFSDEEGFIIGYKEAALIGDGSSADNNTYLQISNNNCFGIFQVNIDGRSSGGSGTGLTGNEIISNNTCSYIVVYSSVQSNVVESSFIIQNNTLYAKPIRSEFGPFLNFAIQFFGNNRYSLIDGNKIFRGKNNDVYDYGIFAGVNDVKITNNSIIRCFSNYGITYSSGICSNNHVVRDSSDSVSSHIDVGYSNCICVDNILGSRYNDSANTDENVIPISGISIVERNINHINTVTLNISKTFSPTLSGGTVIEYYGPNFSNVIQFNGIGSIRSNYGRDVSIEILKNQNSVDLYGVIPLVKQIPLSAKVISATINWDGTNIEYWENGTIRLEFDGKISGNKVSSTQDITTIPSSSITLTTNSEIRVDQDDLVLRVYIDNIESINEDNDARFFKIDSISLKYVY